MKKRILSLLLCIAVLFSAAGCSGRPERGENSSDESSSSQGGDDEGSKDWDEDEDKDVDAKAAGPVGPVGPAGPVKSSSDSEESEDGEESSSEQSSAGEPYPTTAPTTAPTPAAAIAVQTSAPAKTDAPSKTQAPAKGLEVKDLEEESSSESDEEAIFEENDTTTEKSGTTKTATTLSFDLDGVLNGEYDAGCFVSGDNQVTIMATDKTRVKELLADFDMGGVSVSYKSAELSMDQLRDMKSTLDRRKSEFKIKSVSINVSDNSITAKLEYDGDKYGLRDFVYGMEYSDKVNIEED